MGKKMMILGGSALQVPAIKAAKELDYEIILVDYDENATGFALADVKLVVSTLDKEEVYRQALIYRPDVSTKGWERNRICLMKILCVPR